MDRSLCQQPSTLFCLACVTLHLAIESSNKLAPENTQDMLQQLSSTVMADVLAPVLANTMKEGGPHRNTDSSSGLSFHERNSLVKMKLTFFSLWKSLVGLGIAGIFFDAISCWGIREEAWFSASC
jgi:hypothetical protein